MSAYNPLHTLAFSMQAQPGLYALLLGSGVSKSAGIPTGWDVVVDLLRKLMVLRGVKDGRDPVTWYKEVFGREPEYHKLMDQLSNTRSDRQKLLKKYMTPSIPSVAHAYIAKLVSQGFVKVIITTNFDRLLENALVDEGVEPVVLARVEEVEGMIPLVHTTCTVVKLHGDYMDENIRNTIDELSNYPKPTVDLLQRIFDEYGLVVCGWSGEWDVALNKELARAKGRRYATYWVAHGERVAPASALIRSRRAEVIDTDDAADFFKELQISVDNLHNFDYVRHSNPSSVVALCKRFLSEGGGMIQLSDLIDNQVSAVIDLMDRREHAKGLTAADEIKNYDGMCELVSHLAVTVCQWGTLSHIDLWKPAVERLFQNVSFDDPYDLGVAVGAHPIRVLLYAMAVSSVAAEKYEIIGRVFSYPIGYAARDIRSPFTISDRHLDVADGMNRIQLATARSDDHVMLDGMDRRYFPLSDWMHDRLRGLMANVVPSSRRYTAVFDEAEVLMSLCCGTRINAESDGTWYPIGCFGYRPRAVDIVLGRVKESIDSFGDESPYLKFGIVGSDKEGALANMQAFVDFVHSVRSLKAIL